MTLPAFEHETAANPRYSILWLHGLGADPIRFAVPPPPAVVTVRVRRTETTMRPRLRALHVDAERGVVRLVHDHTFRYDPRRAPRWVQVAAAGTGAS